MTAPLVTRVQRGDDLDYTPGADVVAGDVAVIGETTGVVGHDATSGTLTARSVYGVFKFPKSTSAGSAIADGTRVYWDATNKIVAKTRAAGNFKLLGTTVGATVDGDSKVNVRLFGHADSGAAGFANVAAATVITNSTAELTFDQFYTIPAGLLKAGMTVKVRAVVVCPSTNSTDTLTLRLYFNGTGVVASAAVDVANNDVGVLDMDVIIRTDGASGTFVGGGTSNLAGTTKNGALGSTAVDTTAAVICKCTAQWSAASASDQARLDIFDVQLIPA